MARRRSSPSKNTGCGCGAIVLLLLLCIGCTAARGGSSDRTASAPSRSATATSAPRAALAPSPTIAPPTIAPIPTKTPTPTPARTGRVSDASGWCWVTLPGGFAEDRPGSGYFPATDGTAFVVLDGPDPISGPHTPDEAASAATERVTALVADYAEVNAAHTEDATHLAFVGTVGGQSGHGSILARAFDGQLCILTFFALDSAPTAFELTLGALHASFNTITAAVAPTPTTAPPTAVPPTATATTRPPTAAPIAPPTATPRPPRSG